jgi:hypothetical protein
MMMPKEVFTGVTDIDDIITRWRALPDGHADIQRSALMQIIAEVERLRALVAGKYYECPHCPMNGFIPEPKS